MPFPYVLLSPRLVDNTVVTPSSIHRNLGRLRHMLRLGLHRPSHRLRLRLHRRSRSRTLTRPADQARIPKRVRRLGQDLERLRGQSVITNPLELHQRRADPPDDAGQRPGVDIRAPLEQVPPDGAREGGVALDEAFVVGEQEPPPLDEDVLEIALAEGRRGDVVVDVHLLLALEEEVVRQLVLPVVEGVAVEAAYARVDEVEVEHCYVGPGAKGGRELEFCQVSNERA